MSHDLGPGTFESHWFFLGYCDGVAGGLGKNQKEGQGGIDSPLVLRPPRQKEQMDSLAVPNSAANIHLEDGRTPESLSCEDHS